MMDVDDGLVKPSNLGKPVPSKVTRIVESFQFPIEDVDGNISKNGGEEIFGIEQGMTKEEVRRILGSP